ncbi:hypothetical protein Tco_0736788 [Tanacetum coccineum]
MRSVGMALGEVVTNLPPSTPCWKEDIERFWDVLMNSRLGWQVRSWKEMLSIGGRILNKPKEVWATKVGRFVVRRQAPSWRTGQAFQWNMEKSVVESSVRITNNTGYWDRSSTCPYSIRIEIIGVMTERVLTVRSYDRQVATIIQKS